MKKRNSDIWLKLPVWVLGMGPLAWCVWAFFADELGADPEHRIRLHLGATDASKHRVETDAARGAAFV